MANAASLYDTLSVEPGSFRLMKLLYDSDPDSTIKGILYHASLKDRPHFDALSYVWGSEDPDQDPIILNEQPFHVTQNLKSALRRIRKHSPDGRTLWIDAICIHQDNLDERNVQVRQMRQIYESAKSVIVCLDDDDAQGEVYAKVVPLLDILALFQDLTDSVTLENKSRTLDVVASQIWEILPGYEVWMAIPFLFLSLWFARAWTVQEIAVAREAVVIYGNNTMSWTAFEKAVNFLNDMHNHLEQYPSLSRNAAGNIRLADGTTFVNEDQQKTVMLSNTVLAKEFVALKQRYANQGHTDLLTLLIQTWHCDATDHRDKIFAVLGLLDSSNEALPEIDYSLSIVDVFSAATKGILLGHRGLDVLTLAGISRTVTIALPSWCPDWRACEQVAQADQMWLLGHKHYSNWAAGGLSPTIVEAADAKVLKLKGVIVDAIQEIWPLQNELEHMLGRMRRLQENSTTNQDFVLEDEQNSDSFALSQRLFVDVASLGTLVVGEGTDNSFQLLPSHATNSDGSHSNKVNLDSDSSRLNTTNAVGNLIDIMRNQKERQLIRLSQIGLGLAPAESQEHDVVCILFGGRTPFVLRRIDAPEHWILIGTCYISGIMHGEIMREIEDGRRKIKTFEIW